MTEFCWVFGSWEEVRLFIWVIGMFSRLCATDGSSVVYMPMVERPICSRAIYGVISLGESSLRRVGEPSFEELSLACLLDND